MNKQMRNVECDSYALIDKKEESFECDDVGIGY